MNQLTDWMGLAMCAGAVMMVIICLVQWFLIYRVLSSLKNRFPQRWTELGKPTLILNNSLRNNVVLYAFLWRRDYLALGGSSFTGLCTTLRSFSIFGLAVAVIWVMAIAAFIYSHPYAKGA